MRKSTYPMSRAEYIRRLAELYWAANLSDSGDNPQRSGWMKGNESATHCQQYDKIARDMGLGENWLEENA